MKDCYTPLRELKLRCEDKQHADFKPIYDSDTHFFLYRNFWEKQ